MAKAVSAVGITGLGLIVLWSGITNAGILNTLQSLIQGQKPVPGSPQAPANISLFGMGSANKASYTAPGGGTSPSGTGTGSAIVNAATPYAGGVYWWGGTVPSQDGGRGVDCYGLLTYVLHTKLGYNLPNNSHSGYLEFLAWKGAYVVPRSQIQPGDLIIWPSHSGISLGGDQMISAENPRAGVQINTIEGGGPLIPEPLTILRVGGGLNFA